MTEPVNIKNFGGVDFNWNQVKSAKVEKGKDGKKTFFIEFKTGVKMEYPMQQGDTSAGSKELTMWQSLDYDNETVIYGLKNAKITGSKNDDHIIGRGIKGCRIDVSNDNNDDKVDVNKGAEYKYPDHTLEKHIESEDNTIVMDKKDKATQLQTHVTYAKDGKVEKFKREINVEGPGIENRF